MESKPIILALGRQKQEGLGFEANLGTVARSVSKTKQIPQDRLLTTVHDTVKSSPK